MGMENRGLVGQFYMNASPLDAEQSSVRCLSKQKIGDLILRDSKLLLESTRRRDGSQCVRVNPVFQLDFLSLNKTHQPMSPTCMLGSPHHCLILTSATTPQISRQYF